MRRLERSVRVWASNDILEYTRVFEILWAEDHPDSNLLKEGGLRSGDLEEPVPIPEWMSWAQDGSSDRRRGESVCGQETSRSHRN